ncbi:MAG: ATP-binding cassette domain-containing protein [Cyanobacteria bacterium J06621_11]
MLKGENLWFRYSDRHPWVIQNRSLAVAPGEVLGLMAPSGYGKTTLGKLLAGFASPSKGQVTLAGSPLPKKGYSPVQLIFQNPELSVNPRWHIRQILQEGYFVEPEYLDALGIHSGWLSRYPHELSGGELQRVAIARILNSKTKYIVADEITAMLDANTQALIWQTVLDFAAQRQVGLIVISHERRLLERLCHSILILDSAIPSPCIVVTTASR